MTHFRNTFMGTVGFEEIKRYTRQGTEFCREIVNILNERAMLEQNYAKSLRRLGQRMSKAACSVLGSPMSSSWKTVGVETEKEAELHRDFGLSLIEECIKPLSTVTEKQLKPRRMMEQRVDSRFKTWTDKHAEHIKIKRRLHQLQRENESLREQIDGPRPKTDRDQQKLMAKQQRGEEQIQRTDLEYYNSLIQLEASRQDWESASFECCDAVEDMEDDKFRQLNHVLGKYVDNLYEIPSKMKSMCRILDDACEGLSPQTEILLVADKLKGAPYMSEQLLCDFYQENFSCPMSPDRRRASVNKLLERYIADCQKERAHRDGLKRLAEASKDNDPKNQSDISNRLLQSSAMLTFFDIIRYKLNLTLSSIDGSSRPQHPLSNCMENHTDKQGILYTVFRSRPGEAYERLQEKEKSQHKSKSKSKSKSRAPVTRHRSSSLENHRNHSNHNHHQKKNYETVSAATGKVMRDNRRTSNASVTSSSTKNSVPPASPEFETPVETPAKPEVTNSGETTVLCRCVAIYDYAATRPDELSIKEGDVINVFEKGEDDWWRGEVNNQSGLFPANYVDVEISV
uniref:Nostrin n=1 Tax=Ciona intestinalis TaxID=7719 RepID=H2XLJ6_CIOIN|nr:nostrin [Ciona intestinalis]XP_026690622.1 nostrin [Ciona intestinalis]XP_026690623.1 nostrin [Ciona intestinalis]|eukprot:XP_026690621.1 nostrin [Ciona intestinalis]